MAEENNSQIGLAVIIGLFNFLTRVISAIFDRYVILGVTAIIVGGDVSRLALLPEKDRVNAKTFLNLGDTISNIVGSNIFAWTGWILLTLIVLIGVPFVSIQHQRIKAQGSTIAKLRDERYPERLSSHNANQLLAYPEKSESDCRRKDSENS